MNGYNKSEIKRIKEIDVIDYLLHHHPAKFNYNKEKQQLIYKANPDFIIYKEDDGITHGYDFNRNVSHPYKDNIGVLQYCLNMTFLEACNTLVRYAKDKGNWKVVEDVCNDGMMIIPDGIDNVID